MTRYGETAKREDVWNPERRDRVVDEKTSWWRFQECVIESADCHRCKYRELAARWNDET